ncbi:RNA polymerase II elongation factor ELL-like [Tigriopus californicus]|nr:RNA polymerase II elongation factor ELL-like [Tigriopus californicus]
MAVLVGGQTWGLSSANSSKKTVVLVKLTDSSLRALENYIHNKSVFGSASQDDPQPGQSPPVPTIQFHQDGSSDSGAFSIPMGHDKSANFSFSLSSNDDVNGPQGSFECLSSEPSRTLVSLGTIPEKLHVQASDDAYKRFGQKMIEANEEKNKRTTQLLEQNCGKGLVASKAKFVRKSRPHLPVPSNKLSPHPRLRDPGGGSNLPQRTRSPTIMHSSSTSSSSNASAPPSRAVAPNSSSSSSSSSFLSETHPMLNRSPKGRSMMNFKPHSEIMKRPLKERIIHLLAVRPYKKPELLSRVTRDGIRDKDKKHITMILKQVSYMKDNCYFLLRHIWNDVSEDWPFYSEQERQAFRRRKPQNLTPPFSDGSTSSSGHSPSSTHAASPPSSISPNGTSSPQGRKRGPAFFEDIAAKKRRVSKYVRPADERNSSPQKTGSPFQNAPHQTTILGGVDRGEGLNDENESVMTNYYGGDGGANKQNMPPWDEYTPNSSPELNKSPSPSPSPMMESAPVRQQPSHPSTTPPPPPANDSPAPPRLSPTKEEKKSPPSFMKEFTKVVSQKQRRAYKKEFDVDYQTYTKLHSQLSEVRPKFAALESQLNQENRESETRRRIKSKIHEEYKEFKRMKNYFGYLHTKLAHIRKLVNEYDQTAATKKNATPAAIVPQVS